MGAPPILSTEERRAALRAAVAARKLRAAFKEEIKSGSKSWKDAFSASDDSIKKMRVRELIESLPGYGEVRAKNILEKAGISPTRRVGGVGRSQYEKLLELLKGDK
ncbi:MAG: integration host factor [Actinobacteria bacterium]|nr:integration host factor [Actinomycetota bacterium]